MQQNAFDHEPKTEIIRSDGEVRLVLRGDWTSSLGREAQSYADELLRVDKSEKAIFDLSGVNRLDTVGGWLIVRSVQELQSRGIAVVIEGLSVVHETLLDEISAHTVEQVSARSVRQSKIAKKSSIVSFLAYIGKAVIQTKRDVITGVAFFGEIVAAIIRLIFKPLTFRFASFVAQLELVALRGVPIIVLISFLVGCIIAQQSIFQLRTFGATSFVVDLTSILTLRELAVLLTAIMIAGRSGSAYTAELGSMKMSEEVDALRVMGLDPMEVLIVPRILALVVGLPLLTFIASMAGLLGAMITSVLYGGIALDVFLTRLQMAIAMNTFFAGLIKAPFMALMIGVIACSEGFAVKGSAESLGRHVTSSVVKSIFMVIVIDGVFAMFYAAISF